jgi:pyruvate/2-oxoglutarate dehydrogenase complex dihydrolipoamide acyltransferase (E2) component
MQVLDSIVDGALALPNTREGDELIGQVVRYLRTGETPVAKGNAAAMLTAIWPVLEQSRARALAGSNGGSKQPSKPTSKTASKQPSKTASKRPSKDASKPSSKQASKRPSEEEEEEEIGTRTKDKGLARRFSPPSPTDVRGYAEVAGISLDPERFCDFYASKGWRVGSSPMRDWRAAARNWAKNEGKFGGTSHGGSRVVGVDEFDGYDM